MAIKPLPHSIPSNLPPAKLYLDDIHEIFRILTDSNPDCEATFIAGQSKCDSLDDLKELRTDPRFQALVDRIHRQQKVAAK